MLALIVAMRMPVHHTLHVSHRRRPGILLLVEDTRQKPGRHRDDAITVLTTLRAAGHTAYFAGGCVRDLLLGHEPKDYDVATDAMPQRVRQLFSNTQAVGQAFGVILVRIGRSVIEVATFRGEGSYLDGRRPSQVWFTTAELDAQRRDFTINGLFFNPVSQTVIDYVGGQADLSNHLLRAIGKADERFEEDHLRLLRAVRFAARFDLEIESATEAAIHRHASRLVRISPERIADELRAMLTPPARVKAYELLAKLGLLDVIFRFTDKAIAPKPEWLTRIRIGQLIPFGFAMAAITVASLLAHGVEFLAKPEVIHLTHAFRQSLRLSNEELEEFEQTLHGVRLLIHEGPLTLARKKRFLARATASYSRELVRAMETSDFESLDGELSMIEKSEFAPPPLLTGDDLTAAGMKPGPQFKRVLDAVYDAQLEGRIATQKEAICMGLELFSVR